MKIGGLILIVFLILPYPITGKSDQENYCTKVLVEPDMEISFYTPSMFRVRISKLRGDKFPPKYEIPFVIGHLNNWPPIIYKFTENNRYLLVYTKVLQLRVEKATRKWQVFTKDGKKKIYPSDGPIYGLFRDGYTLFDNASAFNEKNNNSRYSHWFYSPKTDRYTGICLPDDLIQDHYFIYGPDYPALFKQFNRLVGPEPMLPKKAYGFFQTQHLGCKGNQEKLLLVAKKMRELKIPCDTLIIDFEWGDGCDGEKEVKWGSRLDWSSRYTKPLSPGQMIQKLRRMNYQVMLIHHNAPAFQNRFNQGWTESVYPERVWWRKFKEKLALGVAGTWQDTRRNDITDSVIWKGIEDHFLGKRRVLFLGCRKMQALNPWDKYYTALPMNQMIGSRRYPFDWTGDCSFSWNEFAWQVKAITNTHGSMKGISYMTSDAIGANWKIQARWNQFADFSTISRSHNAKPWSGTIDIKDFAQRVRLGNRNLKNETKNHLPNSANLRKTALASIRKHRRLRYRLIPYIYSTAHINTLTGMPVCRPMLLAFANDHRCSGDQWPNQYMFGESFLVAPVTGDFTYMEIYLPHGEEWIDFWDHTIYQGGGILRYDVRDINKLPLFIKRGAIIPMRQPGYWIDPAIADDPLTLRIYPKENGKWDFLLIEDDGVSLEYMKGRVGKTKIVAKVIPHRGLELAVGPLSGDFKGKLLSRNFIVELTLQPSPPAKVILNGKTVPMKKGKIALPSAWWQYAAKDQMVTIRFHSKTNSPNVIQIIE